MKKIMYDSWIAKHLLFKNYSTITLAAWVCTRYKNKDEMPQRVRNHESVHARQWCECMLASGVIIWALMLILNISPWWLALSFLMFYIFYVLEWLIKLCFYGAKAYSHISFEREANAGETDSGYLESEGYFRWVKFVKDDKANGAAR